MQPYLDYFTSRGHKIYFFVLGLPIAVKCDSQIFDISYGAKSRTFLTKWKYFLAPIKLRKILKEIKPDILHGHYATSAGVAALLSGFRPFIISARGSDLLMRSKYFFWRKLLQRIFRKSALVHTVSDELSKKAQSLGVPDEKILTLTQGVDTNLFAFKPRDTICSPVRLLCTRSLREYPYKLMDILNACLILNRRDIDFKLTFAAGGPMENELKRFASEMGLSNKINFLGGYDNSSLPNIMNEHDIYLSASLWDGTSVSLLEAMSCGLFPVISRTKSNCSWIKENQTGLMFECGKVEELAAKIIQAISDKNLFRTAIETNRRVIEEKADRQKNMKILEDIYYKLSSVKDSA